MRDVDGKVRTLVEAFKAAEKLRSKIPYHDDGTQTQKKHDMTKRLEGHEFAAEQAGILLVGDLLSDVGRIADAIEIIAAEITRGGLA